MRARSRVSRLSRIALAAALLACVGGHAAESPSGPTHERGREVYNFRCYFCHGYSGNGQTTASQYLTPRPRDFTATDPKQLSRESMLDAVTHGRAGSAMQSYAEILSQRDIAAVVDFVRSEFMLARAPNVRYHDARNGWSDHSRYADAFAFVRGEIGIDQPVHTLSAAQRRGRDLYLSTCVTCHDRRPHGTHEVEWKSRPLSYPLNGDTPTNQPPRQTTNQYRIHERKPQVAGLDALERRGESLFQANCSFCHAADGTGKNWIGSFMEPPARNLTGNDLDGVTVERLAFVIREGLPGTSMPAWKNVLRPSEVKAVAAYVMRAFRPGERRRHAMAAQDGARQTAPAPPRHR